MFMAAAAALLVALSSARADFKLYIDGSNEFSGSGATFTGQIVVTFANAGANTVTMTIDASGAAPTSTGKIDQLNFNVVNSIITPSTISSSPPINVVGSVGSATFSTNDNGSSGPNTPFKADGDGYFDLVYQFPTAASADPFSLGEVIAFTLTGTGLTENAFNDVSVGGGDPTKTGFYIAAHVQSVNGPGLPSGWFSGDPVSPTPAPSSLILLALGSGLTGLVTVLRMRRARTAVVA
jgi:hypothetical protein